MIFDGCGSAVDDGTCVMIGSGTSTESTGRNAAVEVGSSTDSMTVEVEMIADVEVAGIALDRGAGSCAGGACCADVALGCCSAVELACCCDDGSGCAGSGMTLGIVVGSGALTTLVDEGRTAEELGSRVEDGSSTGTAMDGDGRGALVGLGTGREDSLIEDGMEDETETLEKSGISVDVNVGNRAVVEGRGSASGTTMGSDVGNGALEIGIGSVVGIAVVDGAA